MTDLTRGDHPDLSRSSLDAAVGSVTRTSGLPGRRFRQRHGATPRTMASSTAMIDISSFGVWGAYLAACLDGLKTALGLNQLEVYGSNAGFVEEDGDGDETVEIGAIGHVVNFNLGALRETPVELWSAKAWAEMDAVATCSLDVRTAEALGIEYKPLPADAKRIVDKLSAGGGGGRARRARSDLTGDLDAETQDESGTQAAGTRGGRQAAVAAAAAVATAAAAADAARDRALRLRGAAREHGTEGPAGKYAVSPTTAERIVAARARLSGAAGGGAKPADTPGGGDAGRGASAAEAAAGAERLAAAAEAEAAELEAAAAKAVETAAAALGALVADEGAAPRSSPAAAGQSAAARVAHPTPNLGLLRPRGTTAPTPAAESREAYHGARGFSATEQARLAESSMRTQDAARELTAELTSLHVRYKNALRAALPVGVRRPAEVGDLGPSAVACIRSTLFAQTELADAILRDLERLAGKSRSAKTVYERLREDVRDQTICDAITSGEVQVELSVVEAVYGVFPFGQAMAVLAAAAFTPTGDHDLSRHILETVRSQGLMVGDEFEPSAAAVAINRAIQKGKRSKASLDWDKIARAVYGLFAAVPMSLNYRDGGLDLVATVCDMNGLLLQAPGERFARRDVESALGLIKRFGDSVDRRKTVADLARARHTVDLGESGGRVLLTEGSGPERSGAQGESTARLAVAEALPEWTRATRASTTTTPTASATMRRAGSRRRETSAASGAARRPARQEVPGPLLDGGLRAHA